MGNFFPRLELGTCGTQSRHFNRCETSSLYITGSLLLAIYCTYYPGWMAELIASLPDKQEVMGSILSRVSDSILGYETDVKFSFTVYFIHIHLSMRGNKAICKPTYIVYIYIIYIYIQVLYIVYTVEAMPNRLTTQF